MNVPDTSFDEAALGTADSLELSDPSIEFRDDLIAANRFKSFLVSSGADVPERVIAGLAKLTAEYLYDAVGEEVKLKDVASIVVVKD